MHVLRNTFCLAVWVTLAQQPERGLARARTTFRRLLFRPTRAPQRFAVPGGGFRNPVSCHEISSVVRHGLPRCDAGTGGKLSLRRSVAIFPGGAEMSLN